MPRAAPAAQTCPHGTEVSSNIACALCLADWQLSRTHGRSRAQADGTELCEHGRRISGRLICSSCSALMDLERAFPGALPPPARNLPNPVELPSLYQHPAYASSQSVVLDSEGEHPPLAGWHDHPHKAHDGPSSNGDGLHSHMHLHAWNDTHLHSHAGVHDSTPVPVTEVQGGQVSSAGRRELSQAARAALRNLARREEDGSLVVLPSPPRDLDSIQKISWAEEQVRTAHQEWAKVWEFCCDLKETALPDAAGKAAVRKAEQLAESLCRRKDAAEAMAARFRTQHDELANSISISGYETREQSLLARAAREGRLA